MSRLKAELQFLRKRGALKSSAGTGSSEAGERGEGSGSRSCARCRSALGRIINRGASCKSCRQRVCKSCREFQRGNEWVCSLCFKNAQLQAASGQWMNSLSRNPSRRKNSKDYVAPAEIVARSIRRSWTISSPSASKELPPSPDLDHYQSLQPPARRNYYQAQAHHPIPDENQPPMDFQRSESDVQASGNDRAARGHQRIAPRRSASLSQADTALYDDHILATSKYNSSTTRLFYEDHQRNDRKHVSQPGYNQDRSRSKTKNENADVESEVVWKSRWRSSSPPPVLEDWVPIKPPHLAWAKAVPVETSDDSRKTSRRRSIEQQSLPRRTQQLRDDFIPRSVSGEMIYLERDPDAPSTYIRQRTQSIDRGSSQEVPLRYKTYEEELRDYKIRTGSVDRLALRGRQGRGIRMGTLSQVGRSIPTSLERRGSEPSREAYRRRESDSSSSSNGRSGVQRRASSAATDFSNSTGTGAGSSEQGRSARDSKGRNVNRVYIDAAPENQSEPNNIRVTMIDSHSLRRPPKTADNASGPSTIPRAGKRSSSREHFGSTTVYLEAPSADSERQNALRDAATEASDLPTEDQVDEKDYDIEHLTGTIFQKVTIKRRKQESSNLVAHKLGTAPYAALANSPLLMKRTTHSVQDITYTIRTTQSANTYTENDTSHAENEMQDAAVQTSALTSDDDENLDEFSIDEQNCGTEGTGSPLLHMDDRRSLMTSDICTGLPYNSDTASDIVLDANKIVPEGDDYKLVFISSDSSKSSLEESFETSDQSPVHSRNPSSVTESDTAGFIDESDWDLFSSGVKKSTQRGKISSKTRHNSSSDESKAKQKNGRRKYKWSRQPVSENDGKSSTLGSVTSSDNNSPRTFMMDDFTWDHSQEHLLKVATVAAPTSERSQLNDSRWSTECAEEDVESSVTYTTREVQTDMGHFDSEDFGLVSERTANVSPTRSLEEWETMSHIRASGVSTPGCLHRGLAVTDESTNNYVPIWQISTSSRSSCHSLHNLLSTCMETQTETPNPLDLKQTGSKLARFEEDSFLINAAALDDSYMCYVDPPGGGSFSDSPSSDYARAAHEYKQSVKNRFFCRSDSKRSSGERSMEELSFHEHIFAHDNVISSLYSPDGLALPGFQEYRNQILTEIQAYTAKGDWNLVGACAPEVLSPPVKEESNLLNSSAYQSDKKVCQDLSFNVARPSPISRARLGNYCVWPTGSRIVPNTTGRWRRDPPHEPAHRDFHTASRQTSVALAGAAFVSGVSVETTENCEENNLQSAKYSASYVSDEQPPAFYGDKSLDSTVCESSEVNKVNCGENFSLVNTASPRSLDMNCENNSEENSPGEEKSTCSVHSQLEERPEEENNTGSDFISESGEALQESAGPKNETAAGVSEFSRSEAHERPSNLGLEPQGNGSLVSPTVVESALEESGCVADCSNQGEQHLAGDHVSPPANHQQSQPIHLFLALSRECSVALEEEQQEAVATVPVSPQLSHEKLTEPGSEISSLRGESHQPDPCFSTTEGLLDACAMELNDAQSIGTIDTPCLPQAAVESEAPTGSDDFSSDQTGSGESVEQIESRVRSEVIEKELHDDARDSFVSPCSAPDGVNNTDLAGLDESVAVQALNSYVTLPDSLQASQNNENKQVQSEMTLCERDSRSPQSAESQTNPRQSRFQVSQVAGAPGDARRNQRLLSDSDVPTSGDEGESPSFDTDSQQDTVIEGQTQSFQDLRQFALKHSLSLARKDSSLSPTPPALYEASDAQQSDTDSSSSRCSLRPSSFPASPVPSDGRLTPRRAQGQYTSYVLITQEESESLKSEKVISDDESRVTVTVPQGPSSEKATVCVVEVPAKRNWMDSHDDNTDSESQDVTEDSGSCVTVSGNGVLTDHDVEEETSADEDTLTDHAESSSNLTKYFTLALESGFSARRKQPVVYRNPERNRPSSPDPFSEESEKADSSIDQTHASLESAGDSEAQHYESDPSEKIDSIDDAESNYSESASSGDEAYFDREEELRGYNRAIDFTLHTILEESCEESDGERRSRSDSHNPQSNPSELEKYFTFDLGGGASADHSEAKRRTSFANEESEYSDTFSETSSSIYSEGLEHGSGREEDIDPVELASSRLEKYFMTGFLGLEQGQYPYGVSGLASGGSDGSESVGSDSEGQPSPEQRRRKVVRIRGSRQQASPHAMYRNSERKEVEASLSDACDDEITATSKTEPCATTSSEGSDFSSSEEGEDIVFEKTDGQFDTIKRRKKKRSAGDHDVDRSDKKLPEETVTSPSEAEIAKEDSQTTEDHAPVEENPEQVLDPDNPRKYQSRDSGFVGSCDDLLNESTPSSSMKEVRKRISSDSGSSDPDVEKDSSPAAKSQSTGVLDSSQSKCDENDGGDTKSGKSVGSNGSSGEAAGSLTSTSQSSRSGKLSRKDSFNNWSSDEETNLMMSKMKAFFRNMVSGSGGYKAEENGQRVKPPQLLAFENELTRLMKTVPGINDEQVKEIVEYLSSEDTWSDSYDSSDYTSSDLEGAYAVLDPTLPELDIKSDLQQQISASCQEIIAKFELGRSPIGSNPSVDALGNAPWMPAGEDPSNSLNKETAFVYQRLVNSLMRLNSGPKTSASPPAENNPESKTPTQSPHSSPPMIAKVLQHIGNRLVALMHEVSASSDTTSHAGSIDEDAQSAGRMKDSRIGFEPVTSSPRMNKLPRHFLAKDRSAMGDDNSLNSTSMDSEGSPTDTEQSPDSDDYGQRRKESSNNVKHGFENVHYEKRMSSLPSQFGGSDPKSREDQRGFSSLESAESRGIIGGSRSLKARLAERARTLESERRRAEEKRSAAAEDDTAEEDEDRFIKKERKLPRFSLFRASRDLQSSSSGVSDIAEEKEDEFSGWRSSFESAIAADSRTKLSLEAKRRSAGSASSSELFASNDHLLDRDSRRVRAAGHSSKFSLPNLLERDAVRLAKERERERERSASSDVLLSTSPIASNSHLSVIDQQEDEDIEWDRLVLTRLSSKRRSSVPDTREERATEKTEQRSTTLPRSATALNATEIEIDLGSSPSISASTAGVKKSLSMLLNSSANSASESSLNTSADAPVRSARYRPPGFRPPSAAPTRNQRTPSTSGLQVNTTPRWSTAPLSHRRNVRSMVADDRNESTSSPSFVREGVRTSVASAASGESFSSVSVADTNDDNELSVSNNKPRSSSLSALGIRSDSMASVYSAAGEARYGTVTVKGEVQFGLHYNYRQAALEVLVKQCRDLAPVDIKRNRSDPYVKVYLLPDRSKSGKRKTKVKKHTLCPIFDELLKFHTTLAELEHRTLWLTVWHSDMFGRNDFLGEVTLPLAGKIFDDPTPHWYQLQEQGEALDLSSGFSPVHRGDIIVALKYVPADLSNKKSKKSKGSLHVLVKEAKGLVTTRHNGNIDSLCKGVLLPDKAKAGKNKTGICRRTSNPVWNYTLIFEDVSQQELSERALELVIWNHDRLGAKEFLGGVRLSLGSRSYQGKAVDWLDSTDKEVTLWQSVLDRANLWCEGSIALRHFTE